jgi:hypothetical protein
MPCFHPTHGFVDPARGFSVVARGAHCVPVTFACGKCIGCQNDRIRDWQSRFSLDLQVVGEGMFVTLTYAPEFLPPDGGLSRDHPAAFMHSLRDALRRRCRVSGGTPPVLSYMLVGEYGSETLRAHYHFIILGLWPDDAVAFSRSKGDHLLYRSAFVEACWPHGHVDIGRLLPGSIRYVAHGHVGKENRLAEAFNYCLPHPVTGELFDVARPFSSVSNRPGVGSVWFDKFERDVFPSDVLIVDGERVPVPRYFSKKLRGRYLNKGSVRPSLSETVEELRGRLLDADDLSPFLEAREARSLSPERRFNSTPERLSVREESAFLKRRLLKREL